MEDLQTYTLDGELSIDNNVSERSVRAQAIGRKNYLFVGSDRGGRTAATLYSLVASASATRLIRSRTSRTSWSGCRRILRRLGELLPDMWITANPRARVKIAS